jgi:hypothetical protein
MSFCDEMNFIDVIELVVDEKVWSVSDWFQYLENIGHEAGILFVLPIIITVRSMVSNIFYLKIVSKFLQKSAKQEVSINLKLNFIRQLQKNTLIFFVHNGIILIILPFIIKEFFDIILHPWLHINLFVKLIDKPEEL